MWGHIRQIFVCKAAMRIWCKRYHYTQCVTRRCGKLLANHILS